GGKIFSILMLTIVLPLGSRMASWCIAPRQADPMAAGSGIAPHGPKSVEPGLPVARICCCKTPMLVSRTVLPARSISRRDSPGTGILGFHEVPTWRVSIWPPERSEEHTSELQSLTNLVCRLLLE